MDVFRGGVARAMAALALAFAAMPGRAADTAMPSTVPAEQFFDFPQMERPRLSPEGDALAVLMRNDQGRRILAVIDLADMKNTRIVAAFKDADVIFARWVDDKRLVYQIAEEDRSLAEQRGLGLYAVDRDGSGTRALISRREPPSETGTAIKSRLLVPWNYRFSQTLDDGSGDVIVNHSVHSDNSRRWLHTTATVPMRLDTRTGLLRDALSGPVPDHVFRWYFDDRGVPRAALASEHDVEWVLTADEAGAWQERARFPAYGIAGDRFSISGVGTDGRIYVERDYPDAYGSRSIYRLDPATGLPEKEAFVHIEGFDESLGDKDGTALIGDHHAHRLLGVHYEADAPGTAWLDPAMKALQAKVDERLPGLVNRIDIATCGCAQRVLVTSTSDHQPPVYLLYDRADGTLQRVGAQRPGIDPRLMARTDFERIKARDGHDLPVYVTRPQGKGPWPAVVLVHGGPWVRGADWRWESESQFLASRGYLVVRPEFRGSDGYGSRLKASGYRQWGLTMQDDIADATTWAAAKGLADPRRTCIAGASYGGYATLMGLVRYGDLYRCGIAWAAVSDIDLMYSIDWSDFSDDWKGYGMPMMIGVPVKDAAQLAETSPLKQAAKIHAPLLLVHGGTDYRVPIPHALKMRDALLANKAPVTWIEYPQEGHGWLDPRTRAEFYRRVEAFLAENDGPTPAPAQAEAAR